MKCPVCGTEVRELCDLMSGQACVGCADNEHNVEEHYHHKRMQEEREHEEFLNRLNSGDGFCL